ncbi:hypothetical protein OIU34_20000 [Pararhizobium sp. BT-229]|uniref:hypothetical protein n=1 Tax=Pararhizobium sp. BT-229 TaxID=2986923 RepID=UPI0021F76A26|nr:hypothetical protein [Pararhizobium sp. BT-229]MCV9964170.1 hypothetical protein [Pararhizobium sp. BT-229]
MHLPGFTLGYREYKPQPTTVIYADEQKSLSGNKTIIKRETVDIVWVRVSHSLAYLTFKGKIVKKLEGLYDFYGFLASSRTQVEEAPGRAKRWQIERDSELELHVLAYLEDSPTLGYAQTEYGRKYYKPLANPVWLDSPDAKAGEEFSFDNFPYESRNGLSARNHAATLVWKSSNSDEENAAAFAAFDAMAKAEDHVFTETGLPIPE